MYFAFFRNTDHDYSMSMYSALTRESHVFWPTWRSGPRNILSAIFFSHMKVLPDIHCVKAIRFCDILKWKGVPRQKKYQRILWKPPTIHLATESVLCPCWTSLIYFFHLPTIKIFFAHLDRNNPQIDPFFLFKKKLVMANLRCPTLRLPSNSPSQVITCILADVTL